MSFANLGCDQQSTKTENAPTSKFSTTQPIGTGPVAAIWNEGGFLPMGTEASHEKLIVGFWADGTVIWSTDRKLGGPPYKKAQITAVALATVVDHLNATGYFTLTRQVNFGPDSSYTVIAASARGAHQWVGSWHESSNPNIVVTEQGIQSKADPTIKPPSPAYQHFLKVWADSRAVLEGAIPADGVETQAFDASIYKLGGRGIVVAIKYHDSAHNRRARQHLRTHISRGNQKLATNEPVSGLRSVTLQFEPNDAFVFIKISSMCAMKSQTCSAHRHIA